MIDVDLQLEPDLLTAKADALFGELSDVLECLRRLQSMDIAAKLSGFRCRHQAQYGHCPSEAAIARAIGIDRNDLRRVRLGRIPARSVMAARVSKFLDGDSEIALPRRGGRPKKQVRENQSITY